MCLKIGTALFDIILRSLCETLWNQSENLVKIQWNFSGIFNAPRENL